MKHHLANTLLIFVFLLAACAAPQAPAPVTVVVVVTATSAPAPAPNATPTPAPTPTLAAAAKPAWPASVEEAALANRNNMLAWLSPDGQEVILDAGAEQEKLVAFSLLADQTLILTLYSRHNVIAHYRLVDLPAGQAFDLYQGALPLMAYEISPDGRQFAYIESPGDGAAVKVRAMQPDAQPATVGEAADLPQVEMPSGDIPPYDPLSWLADNRTLLWSNGRGLWASQDGGAARQIYEQPAYYTSGALSPDGRYTFLVTFDMAQGGCYDTDVLDQQTLQVHPIPGAAKCGEQATPYMEAEVTWDESGGVQVQAPGQGDDLATTAWRLVEGAGGALWQEAGPPPAELPHAVSDELSLVDGAIVQTDAQTGQQRSLAPPLPAPLAWVKFAASPDLRWLALVSRNPNEWNTPYTLVLRDLQTGQMTKLHIGMTMIDAYSVFDMAFSPDGAWLAYIPVDEKLAAHPTGKRGLASPPSGAIYSYPVYLVSTARPQEQIRIGDWRSGISTNEAGAVAPGAPFDNPYSLLRWGGPQPFLVWGNAIPYSLARVAPQQIKDIRFLMQDQRMATIIRLGQVSPDGRYLITDNRFFEDSGSTRGKPSVQVVDLQQEKVIHLPFDPAHVSEADPYALAQPLPVWLPDGRLLLSGPAVSKHVYRIDPDGPEFFIAGP